MEMICSLAQLCQNDTEFGNYYSLGTYTTFKLTVIQLDPLEFEILYDGGTLLHDTEAQRHVVFQDLTIICLCGNVYQELLTASILKLWVYFCAIMVLLEATFSILFNLESRSTEK